MSPELTKFLAQLAETVAAADLLFGQSEASVSEPDIVAAAKSVQDLSECLEQFDGDEKRLAAKDLGDALDAIAKNRDAAARRWNDERQS